MGFIVKEVLPFRPATILGLKQYVCDIGDLRFTTTNKDLLAEGKVTIENPLNGVFVDYNYSLQLPAKLRLTETAVNQYEIEADPLSVIMIGVIDPATRKSVGTIVGSYGDVLAATHVSKIFGYVKYNRSGLSSLQGLMSVDTFNVAVPSKYHTAIDYVITPDGGVTKADIGKLQYGFAGVASPYDSFVANSLQSMLLLSIKEGDRCYRKDTGMSYINITGNNGLSSDWQLIEAGSNSIIQSVIDSVSLMASTHSSTVSGNPHRVTKAEVGLSAVPNLDLSSDVALNTTNRHNHVNKSILDNATAAFTVEQVNAIVANTAKVGITPAQASAIVTNTAKVGITPTQASAIVANTAKVGITSQQTADILSANVHKTTVAGNPHQVTKAEVELGNVPNTDFTPSVNNSSIHRMTTSGNPHNVTKAEVGLGSVPNTDFTSEIVLANIHRSIMTGNPHQVTKAEVGLGDVVNHDFTTEVNSNTAHRNVIAGNPHRVTKAELGLGLVPNHDFSTQATNADAHIATVVGNPHRVTKAEVGLGLVPNVDCTNASNITTGMLPSSVLPPVAITDTFVVANEAGQLGLNVQKGDVAVRSDLSRSYINTTGNNVTMSDWHELSTPTDTVLSVNGETGTVVLSTTQIAEGDNLYYTEARVKANANVAANTSMRHSHYNHAVLNAITEPFTTEQANAIVANTAKVGITVAQTNAIVANTAKVGITPAQANSIVDSTNHKNTVSGNPHAVTKAEVGLGNVPNTDFTSVVALNTASRHAHANSITLAAITAPFTTEQASAIVANTAKVGITPAQTSAIVTNTAKVGITAQQTSDITAANSHRSTVSGNPHAVTKAEVGLSNVPNVDLTADVALNTADRHKHLNFVNLAAITASFTIEQASAIVANTAKVGITPTQASAIVANTAKVGITPAQANAIVASTAHDVIVEGNPHRVTKVEVGLSNVPNVDCTNASNITTGTLPSSVLPALAISDTFVVASQVAQLALTVQKGDVAVRSDLSRSYINSTGSNSAMSDWQELSTPSDAISSVNGQTGTVVLTTSDIGEGTNLYYSDVRVNNNPNVSANTVARHGHANKAILDATTASFTTAQTNAIVLNTAKVGITPTQASAIVANTAKVGISTQQTSDIAAANSHRSTISGNPHQVTKSEVGLGSVPNTDFTAEVSANTAARHAHANATILDATNEPFTTAQVNAIVLNTAKVGITPAQASAIVANTDKVGITPAQTSAIAASTVHAAIVVGNPHAVTKADIGLGNVPNVDLTAAVAASTAVNHNHSNKAVLDGATSSFTTEQASAIVANTAKVGITPAQASAIVVNTAKVGIVPQQSSDIVSANSHRVIVAGNPHHVTKAEVGLSNVPNVDCTNASNITTGTLPSSVLPALAIVDTWVCESEAEMFSITVQKGDVVVRADIGRSYINLLGNNNDFSDWQELLSPIDTILSVNGQTGIVVLSTSNVGEGSSLYYTEARVTANVNVAANTAARHAHANKTLLDATTASFTTAQASAIVANTTKVGITIAQSDAIVANTAKVGITPTQASAITASTTHSSITTGNPHAVTKAEVGLSNVPNVDHTAEINLNTAARHAHTNKAILDATNEPFTTAQVNAIVANTAKVGITPAQASAIVANTAKVGITPAQTSDITAANTHRSTVTGNPHAVTKAEVGLGLVPNVDCTNASNITTGMLPSSVIPPIAITDTFVVASQAAQLALTVQKGDVAVRSDLNRTYISKTGANTVMTDWQELSTPTDSVISVNGKTGTVVLSTSDVGEGSNLYYTEARVTANVNVAANTAARHSHANKSILDATTVAFTVAQDNAITANTAKVGITPAQADAIVANTAKVGITPAQASAIVASTTHDSIVTGNPHQVTKAEVGLGSVPNTDFTAEVSLNTANRHNHSNKSILDANTASFTTAQADAIVANTAKVGITTAQANAIIANTAKVGITPQQASDITSANTHRTTVSGNPHAVTKAEVGLGLVPNVDCTNASNITTGTLPSSVLPPLAITDTFVVASQAAQLALTVQKGDVAVRSDLTKTYINVTGSNSAMSDWQELSTPLSPIASVNGQTGTVVLSTSNVAEGTNLYYTEARVSANTNVTANTAARHTHANKASLDLVSGTNTGDQTTITGNAGSATKLATARTINGVAFDGTANITFPVGTGDVTLVGTQTLTNKTLETPVLNKGYTEQVVALIGSDLNVNSGTIQTKTLGADTVFTSSLSSGQSLTLHLTNTGEYVVDWPTITWVSISGNVAPLLASSSVLVFWKINSTLYGTMIGSF